MNNIKTYKSILLTFTIVLLFTLSVATQNIKGQTSTGSWRFSIQTNTVYSTYETIAFSADDTYLASGYLDKVYLFNKSSSIPLWTGTVDGRVNTVAISGNGSYVVVGVDLQKIYLFNNTGSEIWQYEITTGGFHSVSISFDGKYIVGGCGDNKVYLFNNTSPTPLWNYTTGGYINSAKISADGNYIAVGSEDHSLYLFNRSSLSLMWSYPTGGHIYDVAITPVGSYIVAGSLDNTIYFFNLTSSTPLWTNITNGYVQKVDISDDGTYIVANGGSKLYLLNKSSAMPLWTYETENDVEDVAISADGKFIVLGMQDGTLDNTVLIFNDTSPLSSPNPIVSLSQSAQIDCVDITSNGDYFTVQLPRSITLYDRYDLTLPSPPSPQLISFYIIPGFMFSLFIIAYIYTKIMKQNHNS
ncbi:MAG: PQQ-binding-like beta-propeller repeat protein [Candidatus Lokiarchaeota archaeon]|nr:PQQ-binding-like beta-propeller repeat protein [Candidatus Lokiarchaeota archaeon]